MKITVGRATNSDFIIALRNLAAINFPSYSTNKSIAKTLGQVGEAAQVFFKTKTGLLEKYGTQTSNPGEYQISLEKSKDYQRELGAVLDQELEIAIENALTIPEGANLRAIDLHELGPLVVL